MRALNLLKHLDLTGHNEDGLRALMALLKDHADDPEGEYPITIVLDEHKSVVNSPEEIRAFVEGFIMSRVSAFKKVLSLAGEIENEPLN